MCSWSLAMSHNFLVNDSESKSTGKKAEARLENKLRGNLNINQSRKSTQQRVSCYWKTVLFHLSEALLLFFPNKQPIFHCAWNLQSIGKIIKNSLEWEIVYDWNHLFGLGPIPKPKLKIGCNFRPIPKLTETVKS